MFLLVNFGITNTQENMSKAIIGFAHATVEARREHCMTTPNNDCKGDVTKPIKLRILPILCYERS